MARTKNTPRHKPRTTPYVPRPRKQIPEVIEIMENQPNRRWYTSGFHRVFEELPVTTENKPEYTEIKIEFKKNEIEIIIEPEEEEIIDIPGDPLPNCQRCGAKKTPWNGHLWCKMECEMWLRDIRIKRGTN